MGATLILEYKPFAMKFYAILAIFFLFSGNCAFSQKHNGTEQVQQVIVSFFDALAKGETAKMSSYCTMDFLLLENGEQWNTDTLVRKISAPRPSDYYRTNQFFFFNSRFSLKQATLHYLNTAFIKSNGKQLKIEWLESAGLLKIHGNWKLQWMHSTLKSKIEIH